MCSTRCGPGWIDDGTTCRSQSSPPVPIGIAMPSKKYPSSETISGSYNVLFANFAVNSTALTKEHEAGLKHLVAMLKSAKGSKVITIEGRASQTGPETNNIDLSFGRGKAVREYLVKAGADSIGPVAGYGSRDPLKGGKGKEIDVNRSALARIKLATTQKPKRKPRAVSKPKPKGSNYWAIKLSLTGSGGHAGIGGAFAIGKLKNQISGIVHQVSFQGGGIGVGLQTPGADPGWGDWSYFKTDSQYTFEDFDGTLARLTMAGAGFLVGYAAVILSLPNLGANQIDCGGWNLGSVGADASSNVGTLNVIGM